MKNISKPVRAHRVTSAEAEPKTKATLRGGSPRKLMQLQEHETIGLGSEPAPGVWSLDKAGESVDVHVRRRLAVNDIGWVHEAARQGIGIALLPEFACKEDLQAGRLRQVLSEWSSGERPLYALYPTPRHLSQKVTAFIDMLSAGLRSCARRGSDRYHQARADRPGRVLQGRGGRHGTKGTSR